MTTKTDIHREKTLCPYCGNEIEIVAYEEIITKADINKISVVPIP